MGPSSESENGLWIFPEPDLRLTKLQYISTSTRTLASLLASLEEVSPFWSFFSSMKSITSSEQLLFFQLFGDLLLDGQGCIRKFFPQLPRVRAQVRRREKGAIGPWHTRPAGCHLRDHSVWRLFFFPRSCLVVHATWSIIASEKDKTSHLHEFGRSPFCR